MYAPASTAIFATVDTDTEGDQWQALDALLAKFPDGKGAIDKALSEFGSEEGLSFENDIRPAARRRDRDRRVRRRRARTSFS